MEDKMVELNIEVCTCGGNNDCLCEGRAILNEQDDSGEQEYERGYRDGLICGIKRFAWWKDGVQYVGCGFYTLESALSEVDDDLKKT